MGDPEVLTDISFLELSTLLFELRLTNGVKLDYKDDVIENLAASYLAGVSMHCSWLQPALQE